MVRVDLSGLGTAVLVLGMHRSGTSCLAGCLEEAGIFLGNVNRGAPNNRKGNLENRSTMRLNDAVLSSNSGSWANPPATITWNATQTSRRDEVLEEYLGQPIFALKDPRMILVIDGWTDVLTDWRPVATFRHPMAVARSLRVRSGLPLEAGIELWLAYNTRLLEILGFHPGPVVSFDNPFDRYTNRVAAVATQLGLDPPSRFVFPEDRLRTEAFDSVNDLGHRVREVYETLNTLASS